MDIKPSYNCLMGYPWIYAVGAISSSLHQKIKFIIATGWLLFIEKKRSLHLFLTHHCHMLTHQRKSLIAL
ncbi:hypothetical protein PTKIN_Ptkin13bG0022600 [Pterospermum kingtungense]